MRLPLALRGCTFALGASQMNAHAEKIIASVLATLALGFMALWLVVPGWALHPPRLDVSSAVLVPLGHIGMRCRFGDSTTLLLALGPILAFGGYLGWAWIRGQLKYALSIAAIVLRTGRRRGVLDGGRLTMTQASNQSSANAGKPSRASPDATGSAWQRLNERFATTEAPPKYHLRFPVSGSTCGRPG
jgi:hypothetical protein